MLCTKKTDNSRRPRRIPDTGMPIKARARKSERKPKWDSTVQDLSVHKASNEEIDWRRRIHKSKNAECAKHELYDKATGQKSSKAPKLKSPNKTVSTNKKTAALRQKLHGEKLYEVLAKSDKTLSLVKDLFGDDPKCYVGAPNVTVAPHIFKRKKALEKTILENSVGGPSPTVMRSPAGIRDESVAELVTGKPALNEVPSSSDSESDDSSLSSQQEGFRPILDIKRPSQPEASTTLKVTARSNQPSSMESSLCSITDMSSINADSGANKDNTIDSNLSDVGGKVQASLVLEGTGDDQELSNSPLKSVLNPGKLPYINSPLPEVPGINQNGFSNVVQALTDLDTELKRLENKPGRSAAKGIPPEHRADLTASGLCTVLPTVINKLVHFINESGHQLEGEMLLRGQLLQTMSDQQNLMDALTSDVMNLREKNVALRKELESTKRTFVERLAEVQKDVQLCFESYHKILLMLPVTPVCCNHQVAADIPITVSASGSRSPYKESPFYPSSVVLSPVKNEELSHATEVYYSNAQFQSTKGTLSTAALPSTITSTGISFQGHGLTSQNNAFVTAIPTNNNSSFPFYSAVPNYNASNQMSSLVDNVLVAPAPPPLNSALQPRQISLLLQHDGKMPSSGSTSSAATNSNVVKQPVVNGDAQSENMRDGVFKDPSSELVEQHNVRVVPAVLSFDSPSLFSPSSCAEQSSLSLSNILQSSSETLVSSSSSKAATLSQPSSSNSAPFGGRLSSNQQPSLHSQGVMWSHPQINSKAVFSNMSPQWISGKSSYLDNQDKSKDAGGWFSLSSHVSVKTTSP
ncbi:spindle and centriole-associated protein 1-like isoform X3 [Dysidea avara]|uniref:spindle and centriole-associated protein 1-like isoform X3 n=1 Tax=Dysidea avara TaxID=196820 RepID=UPI00332A1392